MFTMPSRPRRGRVAVSFYLSLIKELQFSLKGGDNLSRWHVDLMLVCGFLEEI